MAEPVVWKSTFDVFSGDEPVGNQASPEILGLSNGNILVAWVDYDDSVVDDGDHHILGKLYSATGKDLGAPFVIDAAGAGEGRFEVAATNNGGFAIAFADADGNIAWQRHKADGTRVQSRIVASETDDDRVANPQIAVDLETNASIVGFNTRAKADGDVDSYATTISAAGVALAEIYQVAENAGNQNEILRDIVILKNGNAISAAEQSTGLMGAASDTSIGIVATATGADITHFEIEDPRASANLTTLSNGRWVVASTPSYEWPATGPNSVDFGIGKANGDKVGDGTVAADNAYEPQVVGLPDGGFAIAWYESAALMVRVFDNDGTARHTDAVEVAQINRADFSVSVTGDGRLLFAWVSEEDVFTGEYTEQDYDIRAAIWDPRSGTVDAGDFDNVVSNFVATHTVTARVAGGQLHGTSAGDTLIGGASRDTIKGFGGNDMIWGNGASDTLRGGNGKDILSGGGKGDALFGDGGNDKVKGGSGNDRLKGALGKDRLEGGTGNDELDGGKGKDVLFGNGGKDDFVFSAKGATNADRVQDFARKSDDVFLEDKVFKALNHTKNGHLKASDFCLGTSARDGNDHVIYQKSTGKLWYDRDGDGGAGKDLIAEFDNGTALTADDFFVV